MPSPSSVDIERFLDTLDLQRLEDDRAVNDMGGWKEKGGPRWTYKRPHVATT